MTVLPPQSKLRMLCSGHAFTTAFKNAAISAWILDRIASERKNVYSSRHFEHILNIMDFYLAHKEIRLPDPGKVTVAETFNGKSTTSRIVKALRRDQAEEFIYIAPPYQANGYEGYHERKHETEMGEEAQYGKAHVYFAGYTHYSHPNTQVRSKVFIMAGHLSNPIHVSADTFAMLPNGSTYGEIKINAYTAYISGGRTYGGILHADSVYINGEANLYGLAIHANQIVNSASAQSVNFCTLYTSHFVGNRGGYTKIIDYDTDQLNRQLSK